MSDAKVLTEDHDTKPFIVVGITADGRELTEDQVCDLLEQELEPEEVTTFVLRGVLYAMPVDYPEDGPIPLGKGQ